MLQRIILILFISLWAIGANAQYVEKELYKAVKKGNWENCTSQLENYFAELGVSIHDSLLWIPKEPETLYNYYSPKFKYPGIVAGNFPTKKQVWSYWNAWSVNLTDSTWNPRKYFGSKSKARKMANYNVLMLLSHELGHHIADRHGIVNDNLNCHEYIADMASIALILGYEEASKFNLLQSKYDELLVDMNSHISDKDRFNVIKADFHNHCDAIQVIYPKDSTLMPQYASAYFERRKFLTKDKGYESAKELVKDMYLGDQLAWTSKYPRQNSTSNLKFTVSDPFRHESDIAFSRGIRQMENWGADRVYDLMDYYIDEQNKPMHFQMIYPEEVKKGALINLELHNWEGDLAYRYYYYPENNLQLRDIEAFGVYSEGFDKNTSVLILEETKDTTSLFLYQNSSGLRLEKTRLNILADDSRYQLISVRDDDVRIVKSSFEADSVLRFYAIDYDLKKQRAKGNLIFEYDKAKSNFVHWVCTQHGSDSYLLAINQYLLKIDGEKIKTISGTGLEGHKYSGNSPVLNEFELVRALKANKHSILMIDKKIGGPKQRSDVYLKEIKLE